MTAVCPGCGDTAATLVERVGPYRLLECERCSLVYSDPMQAGDRFYYEEHLVYDAVDPETIRLQCRNARSKTNLRLLRSFGKGAKLLDIGCGFGAFVYTARCEGLDAFGIDFNQAQIDAGREFLGLGDKLIAGDVVSLKSCVGRAPSFDLITMFEVIEHVAQPRLLIQQAFNLLKAGGVLAISCPNEARWQPTGRIFVDYPPHHLTRWRPNVLLKLLSEEGFSHLRTELDSSFADLLWVAYVNRSAARKSAQSVAQHEVRRTQTKRDLIVRRVKLDAFRAFRSLCTPADLLLRFFRVGTMGMRLIVQKPLGTDHQHPVAS